MISMKNKRIVESFQKIQPGEARLERILNTAYERVYSEESSLGKKRASSWKRLMPAAACLAALITLSVGGYKVVAEANEYKEAVAFFDTNGFTTAGLSRAEIKEVYRDITTGRFSSNKTAAMFERHVGGYEITHSEPSPEDLKNLWNKLNNAPMDSIYKVDYNESPDSNLGFDTLKSSVLSKRDTNGDIIWSVTFDKLYIDWYVTHGDYIAVYGNEPTWTSWMPTVARVALVKAGDGTILWDKKIDTGYNREHITALVFDGDQLTVFAEGNFKRLIILKYDFNGNGNVIAEQELGDKKHIQQVVKLNDGYLARLRVFDGEESLIKIGADGKLTDTFTYTSADTEYFIADMEEFKGRVYLSTYAIPKLEESAGEGGGRLEIAAILNEIFAKKDWEISNEELTQRMRRHFSAVLLVCDTTSGVPREFYSVTGSIGDTLAIADNGNLIWSVGSITDSLFSPATSSFTIAATCRIYNYEYDTHGSLISQTQTDTVFDYRR